MSLRWRPRFVYSATDITLSLPVRPWDFLEHIVGGDVESGGNVKAAFVVRRDQQLALPLRFFEEEWPLVNALIEYGQTGLPITWYPAADETDISFEVYLDAPEVGDQYNAEPDGEYPRAVYLTLVIRRTDGEGWEEEDLPSYFEPLVLEMEATGGVITEDGDYVIHTFTSDGTFEVLAGETDEAEVLVVAGGGAGGSGASGNNRGGGGGAGGVLVLTGVSLEPGQYTVVVGEGGIAALADGEDSEFDGNVAVGGGHGGNNSSPAAGAGGSGGGGKTNGSGSTFNGAAGAGVPGQGSNGGAGTGFAARGGGGGGAGALGQSGGAGGQGGNGIQSSITGTPVYYGGGGSGGANATLAGGLGGGGTGGLTTAATAGEDGKGGGGGGSGGTPATTRKGGKGVVIVRYPRAT